MTIHPHPVAARSPMRPDTRTARPEAYSGRAATPANHNHPEGHRRMTTHTTPRRVQRRRTAGWRKPDNCVIVSRPSRFGNPCKVGLMQEMGYDDPHAAATGHYQDWLRGNRFNAPTDEADHRRERILQDLPTLRGRDLACTCPPSSACHADVLLEWANLPETELANRIERARRRVDRQRVAWGEEPLHPDAAASGSGGSRAQDGDAQ